MPGTAAATAISVLLDPVLIFIFVCQSNATFEGASFHRFNLFNYCNYFIIAKRHRGVGRGCGVGRGLGAALGVAEGVAVGVGVGVAS